MRGEQQDRAAARHAGRSALYFAEEVMMKPLKLILIACSAVALGRGANGAPPAGVASAPAKPVILSDQSFKNEVQRAIDRGLDWLKADQNTNGWWSTPDHPAVTALP